MKSLGFAGEEQSGPGLKLLGRTWKGCGELGYAGSENVHQQPRAEFALLLPLHSRPATQTLSEILSPRSNHGKVRISSPPPSKPRIPITPSTISCSSVPHLLLVHLAQNLEIQQRPSKLDNLQPQDVRGEGCGDTRVHPLARFPHLSGSGKVRSDSCRLLFQGPWVSGEA